MTSPLDGAVNAAFNEPAPNPPTDWGLYSGGINDNWQGTNTPTIDRHII